MAEKNKSKIKKINVSQLVDFGFEIFLLVIIFLVPTIFDRRLGIVFSGTKVAWMRALISLFVGAWAVKIIIFKEHRFIRTALDWPILSFLLGTTVATLTSIHVYISFLGFYGRYEGLWTWYLFGLLFFAVTNYTKSFDQLRRIIFTVMSAATLMAIYSIIQRQELDPYMWGGVVTWQRVIGTIGQPNFLAAYMIMAFFMTLSLYMLDKKSEGVAAINWFDQLAPIGYFIFAQVIFIVMIYNLDAPQVFTWYFGFGLITVSALLFTYSAERMHPLIFNILAGLVLILTYICILYTQSRGGYMGLACGLVLFPIVCGRKWIFNSWKRLTLLGVLIVLISGITIMRPGYSPFARFAEEITTQDAEQQNEAESKLELKGAAGSRGETWKSAFGIIADNPIFGIGPEALKMVFPRYETELFRFKETFHVKQDRCHNETFDVPVTKGLLTFFVYLWLLFTFFAVGFKKTKVVDNDSRLLLAGLMAAALAYLIQNQFSFGVVAITSLFWVIWAMVMVTGETTDYKPQTNDQRLKNVGEWMEIPWLPIAGILLAVAVSVYFSFLSFRGDIYFKDGKMNLELRRLDIAAKNFENSVGVYPYEGGTVSHLGITYLNLSLNNPGDYEAKAIDTLILGTKLDPFNADNYFLLSKIYLMKGDRGGKEALKKAEEYAKTALKVDPYYAEVYFTLGLIYERMNRLSEVPALYEKAFMINPNLSDPMQALININQRLGKSAETLKVFKKAFEKYPQFPEVSQKLAGLYLDQGKFNEALSVAETLIKYHSKSANGYLLRSEIYIRIGKIDQAFSDLQQIVFSDPKNISAHNGIGQIYYVKGDRARARQEFEQVLMLDPNNAYAQMMLNKVK